MYTLRLQSYSKGEVIFAEGSRGTDAFIVHSGEVEILKSGAQHQPVSLRVLTAGEMFGEMALVTSNPRAASAVAKSDVSLEVIDQDAFSAKLRSDPDFAMHTVQRLAGMIPEAQARFLSQMQGLGEAEKGSRRGLFGRRRAAAPDANAFAPDFVRIEHEPLPWLVRYAGAVILGLMVSVVAWATVATTDTIVTGIGRVITTVPNITVQPFDSGVLRQVSVEAGQRVRQGQVLATLDPTVADADLRTSRSQLASTEAQIGRLRAELAERDPPRFSDDAAEDAGQRQLFAARTAQYRSTMTSHDEEIRSLTAQIASREREVRELDEQLRVLREIAAVRASFYQNEREAFLKDGQYRLQFLESQRSLAAAERESTQLASTLASLRNQVRARQAQRDAWVSDWRARANQDLVTAVKEQSRLVDQLRKADRAKALVEIVAPSDAIVLSAKTRTAGTIVRPGEPLFELAPIDVPVEVEVDVSPRDVARIREHDPVTLKIDSLPFTRHGVIEGTLRLVSSDTFEQTMAGAPGPSYRARITIGASHLVHIPADFRLVPGMTLSADIKTGSRSLVTYITYPVSRALHTSFREP